MRISHRCTLFHRLFIPDLIPLCDCNRGGVLVAACKGSFIDVVDTRIRPRVLPVLHECIYSETGPRQLRTHTAYESTIIRHRPYPVSSSNIWVSPEPIRVPARRRTHRTTTRSPFTLGRIRAVRFVYANMRVVER
jgi:hypothetical protein